MPVAAGTHCARVLILRHGPTGPSFTVQRGVAPYRGGVIASDLRIVAVVALGGAGGALARWAIALGIPWDPPAIPWATLTVNLVGCIAIGLLLTLWTEGSPPAWWVRPMVAVGFVGGFTTFSAFAVEGVRLVEAGAPGIAVFYVVISVVAGLLLVRASAQAMRKLLFTNRGDA